MTEVESKVQVHQVMETDLEDQLIEIELRMDQISEEELQDRKIKWRR